MSNSVIVYRSGSAVLQEKVWNYLVAPLILLTLAALICLLPGMLMTYFLGDVFGFGIYSNPLIALKNSAIWAAFLTLTLAFVFLLFLLRGKKLVHACLQSLAISLFIYIAASILILVFYFVSGFVSAEWNMNAKLVKRGLYHLHIHDFLLHDPSTESKRIPEEYEFAQGMVWKGDIHFTTGAVRTFKMTLERVTPLFLIVRFDEIADGQESLIQSFFIFPHSTSKGNLFLAEDYKSNMLYSFSLTDDLQNLRLSWPASISPNGKFRLVSAGL